MEIKNKKEEKIERKNKRESVKNIIQITIWIVVLAFILYGVFWVATLPKYPQTGIVSSNGLHIHSKLSIIIDGKKVDIPANIGITAISHSPMHTHDSSGKIHIEYVGVVRKKDLDLGNFFSTWGKSFTKKSFMGNPIGNGKTLTMTVNGKKNTEFGKYSMKDGDVIKLIYK